MTETIIVEIVLDLPPRGEDEIHEWIERFRYFNYRNDPRINGTFSSVVSAEWLLDNWHDTLPLDGHIEYAILLPFKDEKAKLRIRGVQRPSSKRSVSAPTIAEYMLAFQDYAKGLAAYLQQATSAKAHMYKRA